jgi:class 3 adenylate cyclase
MGDLSNLKDLVGPLLTVAGMVAAIVALLAKLYHNKVVAQKEVVIEQKNSELARLTAAMARAEARVRDVEQAEALGDKSLSTLREKLTDLVESFADLVNAQAASLYIPIFSGSKERAKSPRCFAFAAAYNTDPKAAAAILKMKTVEIWTIVGQCWQSNSPVVQNDLQSDSRHVASYDSQSGFVPRTTILLPIRWQNEIIAVLQLFNKASDSDRKSVDPAGFAAEDRKNLADALKATAGVSLANLTHTLETSPSVLTFLGLDAEVGLENAVIMHLDLTDSSSLFREVSLSDAANMLSRFSEYVYDELMPFTGIVDRFSGDGTLIRFDFVQFDANDVATNPVIRAVYAARHLHDGFARFKESVWIDLPDSVRSSVRMRISIALGPVVSVNFGPPQSRMPTVMGPCVNRSAKMIVHAPRDRDVILLDDNAAKALRQPRDAALAGGLKPYTWPETVLTESVGWKGHAYFELDPSAGGLPNLAFKHLSGWSA